MPEQFLHGVEIVEIDSGPRPITTVRSSVIGLVGTAPDVEVSTKASLLSGVVADETTILWQAATKGEAGNDLRVWVTAPATPSSPLHVSVAGTLITVSLATDANQVPISTAAAVATAVTNHTAARLLITAQPGEGTTGDGVMAAWPKQRRLTGGTDSPLPANTPVLVTSRAQAARFGRTGTIPAALDAIWDQAGAWVVVVRALPADFDGAELAMITALLAAESVVHVTPRILIAPGYSHRLEITTALISVAERLRAVVIADGPNTTNEEAVTYREGIGSDRCYLVDPQVTWRDLATNTIASQPASPRVAGLISKSDNERGFWWSPSNQVINGITGTARPIDFAINEPLSSANYLNENEVATIIRQDGYRLWGNRTCSADPKWAFLSVRRTADLIHESLLAAHLWAVDRNITKTYIEDVTQGVNDYLAHLVVVGAILGGRCWADPELNTPDQIAQGKVYFDFDFTAPYPAEHITFRSHLVNDYLVDLFSSAT